MEKYIKQSTDYLVCKVSYAAAPGGGLRLVQGHAPCACDCRSCLHEPFHAHRLLLWPLRGRWTPW